jgi:hypothetical protein
VLDRLLRGSAEPSPSDASAVVFDSAEDRASAALVSLAGGTPPWFAPEWPDFERLVEWLLESPEHVRGVVAILGSQSRLESVLQAIPSSGLGALHRSLSGLIPRGRAPTAGLPSEGADESAHGARSKGGRIASDSSPPAAEERALASAVAIVEGLLARAPILAVPSAPWQDAEGRARDAVEPDPVGEPRSVAKERDARDATGVPTQAAGLFYLLNPALELAAGEILWKAGIDERIAFTDAARLLAVGVPADDPALVEFGGAGDATVDWHRAAEVAVRLLRELASTARRRQLPMRPWTLTEAVLHGDEPVLWVGLPPHVPVLAVLPRGARSRIEEVWSLGGPALALPTTGWPPWEASEAHLVSGPREELPRRALAATIAGVLSALASLRLDRYGDVDPAGALPLAIRTEGALVTHPDELVVRVAMEDVRIAVRRAGLDRDPGWIPWHRRRVRFDFVETVPEHSVNAGSVE